MEQNKENINRERISKIPIPLDHLPQLPHHLITSSKANKTVTERCPLRTLNQATSDASCPPGEHIHRRKRVRNINTNHVTVQRPEFQTYSLDDQPYKKEDTTHAQDTENNCLAMCLSAVTPPVQPVNQKEVNKKKSLKRPHSRELQGLSPVENGNQKKHETFVRRLDFKGQSEDAVLTSNSKNYYTGLTQTYTRDIFPYLLSIEKKRIYIPSSDLGRTRACVINWLLKVNRAHNSPAVVQTAVWYLDTLLGLCIIPISKLQVVAAASYWIAQKLDGRLMTSGQLVRLAGNAFDTRELLDVEKNIFKELGFNPQPVVPQDFISYLASWCDSAHSSQIEAAANYMYLSALMVNQNLCEEFPSVVAGAAVKDALVLLGKLNALHILKTCPVYKKIAKKATSLDSVVSILRAAVLMTADPKYDYRAPTELFNGPPYYTSQLIYTNIKRKALN